MKKIIFGGCDLGLKRTGHEFPHRTGTDTQIYRPDADLLFYIPNKRISIKFIKLKLLLIKKVLKQAKKKFGKKFENLEKQFFIFFIFFNFLIFRNFQKF